MWQDEHLKAENEIPLNRGAILAMDLIEHAE